MTLSDWRDAAPALVRACYDAERQYWDDVLAWDTTRTWESVEQARVTWGLPGAVVTASDGQPRGWAFYLPEGDVLSIGGLTADSPDATALLVDAILEASTQQHAALVSCFLPDRAVGLADALRRRGFTLEPHLYLSAPLSGTPSSTTSPTLSSTPSSTRGTAPAALPGLRRGDDWSAADIAATAELLGDAYPGESGIHFAPHGTRTEWLRYVTNLVEQTGCGALEPELTRVVHDGRRVRAIALITNLGGGTAHLAQLAVDRQWRRQRLAETLLREGMRKAGERGFEQMTLLVAASNAPARALYASLGFAPRASFLAAYWRR